MQKIKRSSHLLFLFFRALCWILPMLTAYLILFHFDDLLHYGFWSSIIFTGKIQDTVPFSFLHRLIILSIQLMPLSMMVMICHKLARLFRLYEQGYLFEEDNIRLIKSIGIYMIIGQLVQVVYQPLMTTALSFNNPVGERFASISLGSANASSLITAIIILLASWIIKEANQLKSDSQLTI